MHGYCVEFSKVHTELERTVLSRSENNRRCPLGLNRFHDPQLEHLGDFIPLKLEGIPSKLVWRGMDFSSVLWRYLDSILGCFSSGQKAVLHKFEVQ